jgi:DNA-binding NtrC family response regulator
MPDPSDFRPRVLVVDRDLPETVALVDRLQAEGGMSVAWARDGEAALRLIEAAVDDPFHAMVCELNAQRLGGMRLLAEGLARFPDLCVVLIARRAAVEAATEAMRAGAAEFLAKPVSMERLLAVLRQGISRQELRREVHRLQEQLSDRFGFERLVGRSQGLMDLLARLRQVAPAEVSVLLTGEPGTGKGLIAQALHRNSPRREQPFVSVHCAGAADAVLLEELFGRKRDRGTGSPPGKLEEAGNGTLYLDEVAELSPPAQTRLLRALREGEWDRPDGSRVSGRPRVVSSSSLDLSEWVRRGKFRDDLFHALGAAQLSVPPLRARREDIPLLTHALIEELNHEHGRQVTGVTRGCMDLLLQHSWPGNVRELKGVLSGVVLFIEGRRALEAGDLPEYLRDRPPVPQDFRVRVGMSLAEIERRAIQETMESCGGNKPRAAKILGIGLRTLYRKIQEYDLS